MRPSPRDGGLRPALRRATVLGVALAAFVTTSAALAGFTSSAGTSATYVTKRIFPGVRSAWVWNVDDASAGGAEVSGDDELSYADGVTTNTKNWTTTFATTRFEDFDYAGGRPAGIRVTAASFKFTFAPSRTQDTVCFYLDVRRASTNALLGTHGSSGTPSACTTGAGTTTTVDISAEVTTTDIANDLRIRVYGTNSTSRPMKIDLATVSVTTPYDTSTLMQKRWDDEANAAAAATIWPFVATDATIYTSSGSFATTFNAARYIKFTPNVTVPTGAVITNAQVQLAYRSNTGGDQTCWYFEVYNGATLIGTHGSTTTPVSCNSATTYVTDTVSVPEVSTPAIANAVVIKVYMKNSGARRVRFDLVQLDLNYYLD